MACLSSSQQPVQPKYRSLKLCLFLGASRCFGIFDYSMLFQESFAINIVSNGHSDRPFYVICCYYSISHSIHQVQVSALLLWLSIRFSSFLLTACAQHYLAEQQIKATKELLFHFGLLRGLRVRGIGFQSDHHRRRIIRFSASLS